MEQTSLSGLNTTSRSNLTNPEPQKKREINKEALLERLHPLIISSSARAAAEFPAFREDFTSEGTLAVLTAADRFQQSKGEAEHFAARYLRGRLLNSRRSLRHFYKDIALDILDGPSEQNLDGNSDNSDYQKAQICNSVRRLENSVDGKKIWGVASTVLTANEVQVISLLYMEDAKATEAAERMRISVPRVSQLHTSALKKLRKHFRIILN